MTKQSNEIILVVGATGTVGGATVRELVARGARVRALVRSRERATEVTGAEIVEGNTADPAALDRALTGVHTAFYVSPHEQNEEDLAARFIAACEERGVRLVFVGVHVDAPARPLRALLRLYFGHLMPSYAPKLRISERARQSRTNAVVLMPTNFFDNDDIFRQELSEGLFVQPFDRPFNRVAVQDLAEAAARVCLDRSFPKGAVPVVGPASLDGPACARVWSAALGRPVDYRVDDAAFRSAVLRSARGKKVNDLMSSYAAIRRITLPTSPRDVARTTALLGRPPTPYADYVQARVQAWRAPRSRVAPGQSGHDGE